MPENNVSYTQKVDEKTGEITFVPNQPPDQNGDGDGGSGKGGGGSTQSEGEGESTAPTGKHGGKPNYKYSEDADNMFIDMIDHVEFKEDSRLTDLLKRLEDNNKRLRFDKRLEVGKLDGRRLTAYRTSTRLFKKKAIKHKDYQFTIMLDTSGSMFGDEKDDLDVKNHHAGSKIHIGIISIYKVVKALEDLNIPVAVVAMNYKVNLLKGYKETFNQETFINRLRHNMVGTTERGYDPMGGTDEMVAYEESIKYMTSNSGSKTHNVAIVLSDGEPNENGGMVDITMEGDMYQVQSKRSRSDNLKSYWERQSCVTPYGIGLLSDARQIPRSQRLNHIDKLPELMGNLIQEILL